MNSKLSRHAYINDTTEFPDLTMIVDTELTVLHKGDSFLPLGVSIFYEGKKRISIRPASFVLLDETKKEYARV